MLYRETEFEYEALLPCIMSSIVSFAVYSQLYKGGALFFPGRLEFTIQRDLLPYALIGMIDVFIVVAVARFWFRVPFLGSFWLLFGLSMVFLLSTLGLGLLVSTLSNNQQQSMMTAAFFFLVPQIYLSGFVFPIENMPAAIQPLTYLVPLRYYLVIVRGIFLKGVGMEVLWPQAAANENPAT